MLVAVKIVNIDDMDFSADPRDRDETVRDFRKEVGILQQLKDSGARNVNLIHDAFDLHSQLWIISDYCTGGSVRTLMRANPTPKLEERFIIAIARELAVAMKHVHDIGVIHRDIKCTNVYVTEEGQIQLGDFGIVGVMDDGASKRTTIIGTPWYMPREMHVDAQSVAQGYGTEVDVWSYGCTIFEMATGTVPNAGIAMERLGSVLETAPRLQGGEYSDALRDFVAFCLNSDPKARPTAAQILSHPYIAHTELEFPTKTLVALIERYTMWEFKGGQRTSLFNPGGAAAPAGADSEDHVNDDTEDWNFSTSASFNQEFGKRYSHMILNNLDAPLGAGLPTSQPQNLSVFEQIQREHKEKSANRGEMSLDRLFNPEAAPYAMFAPPVEPQPAPEPSNDLPLRSNEGASAMRESTVMIDLDADLDSSAQPSFNFDFEDLPTIRARSRRGFDDDEEEEEEDNYQYGQHEEGAGDKRATKDWKFPSLPNTAATAPKRATMDWTFSNAQPAEQDDADATMNLPPPGGGSDLAPGFRPQLKHTATVPLGSFGDYIHSNQQSTGPAPPAGDLSRDSMRSMIDLDLGFSETADQPARPSTASSASGSAGTARTSGDPFDLEDTQSRADRNRFSAHKQWQSDGGATDSNRSSLRNVPMHARGSSLSSSASEMERPIQVPAAAEDVFSLNYDEDDDDVHGLARQPVHLSIPRTAPLHGGNDWPDFSQDYGSPAYSSATASQFPEQDYPLSSNDNFNGTNNMQRTVSHSHDTDSEAFRTPTGPQDLLEFPNVVPPNPAALDEDASAATRAAELDRLLDDMRGALKSTSRALRNRAGLDEADSNEPSGGFSSSLDEETDAGFESAGSVGFRSGVETGDEESY